MCFVVGQDAWLAHSTRNEGSGVGTRGACAEPLGHKRERGVASYRDDPRVHFTKHTCIHSLDTQSMSCNMKCHQTKETCGSVTVGSQLHMYMVVSTTVVGEHNEAHIQHRWCALTRVRCEHMHTHIQKTHIQWEHMYMFHNFC